MRSATAVDTAIVRFGPDAECPEVDILLRNHIVTVIGHYQCSYFLVVTPDVVEGWVNRQSLTFDFVCADIEEILELPPMPEPEDPDEFEEDFSTPYATPSAR